MRLKAKSKMVMTIGWTTAVTCHIWSVATRYFVEANLYYGGTEKGAYLFVQ